MIRPNNSLELVLNGKGTESDRAVVREYLTEAERFIQARSGEFNEHIIAEPTSDRGYKMGVYAFCAPDSVEKGNRDFTVTVFKDRTCLWKDEQGSQMALASTFLPMMSLAGNKNAEREVAQQEQLSTFESKIGDDAYYLIMEKEALTSRHYEMPQELCDKIDAALAPYFWQNINRKLKKPLTQIPKRSAVVIARR